MTSFDSLDSELRTRLAAKRLPFHKYKCLCEWLNCFQYINPDSRVVSQVLAKNLFPFSLWRASEVFQMWLLLDTIETSLTIQEQLCLLELLINESEI